MKPKVLIFGCSFSAGRYSRTKQNTEQVHTDVGWYDQLSKDYDYTVYSFHGGGAVNYAYTLSTMYNQNVLKNYQHCIIQQTWEPRFTLYQNEGLEEAKYKGREVKLGAKGAKRAGGGKAYVYVRDPKTKKIKKVTFGSSLPDAMGDSDEHKKRRKSFVNLITIGLKRKI